jgi:hypothetical protein
METAMIHELDDYQLDARQVSALLLLARCGALVATLILAAGTAAALV